MSNGPFDLSVGLQRQMQNTLGNYYVSLQSRFGDPRVYASQVEQMRKDEAAVMHAKAKKTETLLQDAYNRQQERNRATHDERIKNRGKAQDPFQK